MVAEEESQKQQQYGMVQELLRQSNNLREELHNLHCLTKIKAEERGQKHRELLRAQVACYCVNETPPVSYSGCSAYLFFFFFEFLFFSSAYAQSHGGKKLLGF